ncbi:MAG TPA: glucuronate isomerase [Rectinemataceae bacterium]|nr:glucuronate isomerase [Rectinemataceae bacterium]
MKAFMDEDFLLDTDTARRLYHEDAAGLPIFDYHCHLSPREIAEDRPFSDIAELWLKGDHYKWRIMRSNGADESLCSGGASWADKFIAFAAALEQSPGNPLLHWSHLELQRTYGISDVLTVKSALAIRERANAIIKERGDSPKSMLKHYSVAIVCTTDDPADDLRWHEAVAADPEFGTAAAASGKKIARILPAFRPDKAMNAQDAAAWKTYAVALGAAAGIEIRGFSDLADALAKRHAFFHDRGCRLSDHAILVPPFAPASEGELDAIVASLLAGKNVDALARERLGTAVLLHVARLNARAGWTMQLHIAALRNVNARLFSSYGPDGGGDAISDAAIIAPLASFLDRLDAEGSLPKTILYSLDDTKNASLAVLAQCYAGTYAGSAPGGAVAGKMQYGAAWWFNDHLEGMERHLIQSASVGVIGRWVGMLTDSRSFLSYPRHEYFRRILCKVAGRWVESGELPIDDRYARELVRNVSWFNARDYFGIDVPAWAAKII